MFMSDDKKQKMASLIVSKVKSAPGAQEPEKDKITEVPKRDGDEIADADQYDVAVDEMMQAFESKDKAGLKESMKSFIQMCMNEEEDEESESEYV